MTFLKDYQPVEDRLRDFWSEHKAGRIVTTRTDAPEGEYVFVAEVYRDGSDDEPAATGWAHESVASLPANMKASALEVCETSAIGRALANLGYAPRGKRPSREEMASKTAGAGSASSQRSGPPASATTSAATPGETTPGGTGRPTAADGKGSAPEGEAGADPAPHQDLVEADVETLWKLASEAFGGRGVDAIAAYVKSNIDKKDVRGPSDVQGWHLIKMIETLRGAAA